MHAPKNNLRRVFCLTTLLASVTAFAAGSYLWPVSSSINVTQQYKGTSHSGIDIGGTTGSKVVATKSGTVIYVYTGCVNKNAAGSGNKDCAAAGCSPNCKTYDKNGKQICNWGYGNGVIIKHSDGSGYSMYAHMNSVSVREGDTVSQGDKLGTLGSSGYSTGPHLHFELTKTVQQSGTYLKPTSSINSNTSSIAYVDGPTSSSGSTTPAAAVTFSAPTDSKYTSEASIGYDNATVVTKVTKTSGMKVTASGIVVYGPDGSKIKDFQQTVSNVSDAQTTYHIWWDCKNELGLTLQQGTTYSYQFTVTADGKMYYSAKQSFTTKGTTPQPEPAVYPVYVTTYLDNVQIRQTEFQNTTGAFEFTFSDTFSGAQQSSIESNYTYRKSGQVYYFENVDGICYIKLYFVTPQPEPEPEPEPVSPMLSNFSYASSYAGYRDVPSSAWYYENVRSITRLGLMNGVGERQFDPESNITMGETLALATRLHLRYNTGEQDVELTTIPWYQVYVYYAEENGVIDRDYDPLALTDRDTFAKIFCEMLPDSVFSEKNPDIRFSDISPCDNPDAVRKLGQAGVVIGSTDESGRRLYQPDQPITRAEIAAIVTRIVDSSLRQGA